MAPTQTIKSVTCFLTCEDHYLFIHRTKKGNSTDAGRMNGIGGKVHPGEDFLSAAIRETAEETGFLVDPAHCQLKAIVNMSGGYPEDWVMCFFQITVPTLVIPNGMENDEGSLIWLPSNEVLNRKLPLVDDLNYCWEHLSNNDERVLYAGSVVGADLTISQWHSRLL